MKVVLVQPPNPQLSDPTTRWPLGLGYLEAVLRNAGHKVAALDMREGDRGFVSIIAADKPDVVAFTATTGEIDAVKALAKSVKSIDRGILTAVGGAHATFLAGDCLEFFDKVYVGEAESHVETMDWEEHNGLCVCREPENLDGIPFPSRHEFSFSNTLFEGAGYGSGPKATSIITSRGCPFNCAFCQATPRQVRYRSAHNVAGEVRRIQSEWECNHFRFEDDNFTLNRARLEEMCRLFEPMGIHFRCHTRSELFNADVAAMLKLAGCEEVGFGVESADPIVLQVIQKGETLGQHIKAIRICNEAGMKSKAFFMTGLPYETDNIVDFTRDFLEMAKPSKVILSRFTPYPGSAIWEHRLGYGVDWIDPDFSHFWNFPDRTTVTYHGVSSVEMERRYQELYKLLWGK